MRFGEVYRFNDADTLYMYLGKKMNGPSLYDWAFMLHISGPIEDDPVGSWPQELAEYDVKVDDEVW